MTEDTNLWINEKRKTVTLLYCKREIMFLLSRLQMVREEAPWAPLSNPSSTYALFRKRVDVKIESGGGKKGRKERPISMEPNYFSAITSFV